MTCTCTCISILKKNKLNPGFDQENYRATSLRIIIDFMCLWLLEFTPSEFSLLLFFILGLIMPNTYFGHILWIWWRGKMFYGINWFYSSYNIWPVYRNNCAQLVALSIHLFQPNHSCNDNIQEYLHINFSLTFIMFMLADASIQLHVEHDEKQSVESS